MSSALLAAAGAGLIGFHARLLWLRIAEGSLWNPAIGARWAAAALLCAAIVLLRRAGIPLFWGRKALVFWLLVLVLHAASGSAAPDTDFLWTLPAAATTVLCTLLFLVGPAVPAASALVQHARTLTRRAAAGRQRALLGLQLPRPPPLALAR